MNLLALDTGTEFLSIALRTDGPHEAKDGLYLGLRLQWSSTLRKYETRVPHTSSLFSVRPPVDAA